MNRTSRRLFPSTTTIFILGALLIFFIHEWIVPSHAEPPGQTSRQSTKLAPDSAAAYDPNWNKPYPQYQALGKLLKPCPILKPGELCPQDLSIFGGAGRSSFASVDDVANFVEFYRMCSESKPKVMDERNKYMIRRY